MPQRLDLGGLYLGERLQGTCYFRGRSERSKRLQDEGELSKLGSEHSSFWSLVGSEEE